MSIMLLHVHSCSRSARICLQSDTAWCIDGIEYWVKLSQKSHLSASWSHRGHGSQLEPSRSVPECLCLASAGEATIATIVSLCIVGLGFTGSTMMEQFDSRCEKQTEPQIRPRLLFKLWVCLDMTCQHLRASTSHSGQWQFYIWLSHQGTSNPYSFHLGIHRISHQAAMSALDWSAAKEDWERLLERGHDELGNPTLQRSHFGQDSWSKLFGIWRIWGLKAGPLAQTLMQKIQ